MSDNPQIWPGLLYGLRGDFPSRIWEIWTGSDTIRAGWLRGDFPSRIWETWTGSNTIRTGSPLDGMWRQVHHGSYGWPLASILGNFTKPSSPLDGSWRQVHQGCTWQFLLVGAETPTMSYMNKQRVICSTYIRTPLHWWCWRSLCRTQSEFATQLAGLLRRKRSSS